MSDLVRNQEARFSHDEVHMSLVVRKPVFCICENKEQISFAVTAKLISAFFFFVTYIVQSLYFHLRNFKPLAILCGCTAQFMSDLVGNPEDRFSHNGVPGCKIRSLISTSQYYIKRYDIFIDLPRKETCFQHTL